MKKNIHQLYIFYYIYIFLSLGIKFPVICMVQWKFSGNEMIHGKENKLGDNRKDGKMGRSRSPYPNYDYSLQSTVHSPQSTVRHTYPQSHQLNPREKTSPRKNTPQKKINSTTI
jgi:hypothetical protein